MNTPTTNQAGSASTSRPGRRRVVATLTLTAALAAVPLAGCSSHKTSASAGGPTATGSSASATASTKGLPSGVVNDTAVPIKVANTPSLRKHVVITSCAKTESGWAASGTVNNPGTTDKTYTITIFFATNHGTVIGTSHTDVPVPAGGSKQWKAEDSFHAAPETQCVLRGVA